jgi:lipoyl(octanoyl) transferase
MHTADLKAPLRVFTLGLAPYRPVQDLQRRLRADVASGRCEGVLLLLEHPAVITLGSRGGTDDLRDPAAAERARIEVVRSERGGAATLHAPGQLVSYPVLPLPRRDLRAYVTALEEVLIRLVASYGVAATRSDSGRRPGVYVGDRKIASIGLRCERWVASHGTALNVDPDLDLFDLIVSCAESDLRQTSLREAIGMAPPMEAIVRGYAREFAEVFARPVTAPVAADWSDVERLLGLQA